MAEKFFRYFIIYVTSSQKKLGKGGKIDI